ncbi:MAG: hypothetical protein GEV11_08450 [Streptosporangiales bacterium]|nr:hypothetical protein [Streptosporangiales bacterium]
MIRARTVQAVALVLAASALIGLRWQDQRREAQADTPPEAVTVVPPQGSDTFGDMRWRLASYRITSTRGAPLPLPVRPPAGGVYMQAEVEVTVLSPRAERFLDEIAFTFEDADGRTWNAVGDFRDPGVAADRPQRRPGAKFRYVIIGAVARDRAAAVRLELAPGEGHAQDTSVWRGLIQRELPVLRFGSPPAVP